MKQKLINLLLTLCMAFAVIGFVGCDKDKGDDTQSSVESTIPPSSGDSSSGDASVPVKSVSLSSTTLNLAIGDTRTLVANVLPSNATNKTLMWVSSNPSVASVANGVVTAHKVGATTITVKTVDGNKTATCRVTVAEAGSIEYKRTTDNSFYYVSKVTGTLSSVSIPKEYDNLRVVAIGPNAFKGNTYVKTVAIPNSVEWIDNGAFQNCTNLTQINFPESITSIGNNAFDGCTTLESVSLSNKITTIGNYAFSDCSKLRTIDLSSALDTMGMYAFNGCSALQNVALPNSLKTMGVGAFRKATSLQSVTLSTGLNEIPNIAFQGCTALKKIDILANISSIGESAFSDCTGLTDINILGDLTYLGNSAFYLCERVAQIYYNSSSVGALGTGNYILYNVGIQGDGITFTVGKNGCIPNGLFTPYQESNYPNIKAIHIEEGATKIDYLTSDTPLPYLTEVSLASTLTSIGDDFINACHNVTTTQNGVTYLGNWAMSYNGTTSSVTLKAGTTKTNGNIFQGKTALRSITFADSYTNIPANAFNGCTNLSSVILGQVKSIGNYAFNGCTSLRTVIIPTTVTTMGQNVFSNSSNLTVYAKASSKPSSWNSNWSANATVIWGYKDSYTVTFKADGQIIGMDTYTVTNLSVTEPPVPEKPHYTGKWETYTLTHGDITVNAVYTPIEYTVTFKANGTTVATLKYTVENQTITEPTVPTKTGYTGVWESYALNLENITVNAVYTVIPYTVTFKINGETVDVQEYTVENKTITEPTIPEKAHYTGKWETYTLTHGSIIVNAVYTPIEYTVTFKADGTTVATRKYTVENQTIVEPTVPTKTGYMGAWESYALNLENITVNALYIIQYTVTFKADGTTVATRKYTVENQTITEPTVPTKTGYTGVWESYTLKLENITVNAVYTVIPYTLAYVDELNVENPNRVTKYTVESDTIALAPLSAIGSGYSFNGWLCDGQPITEIPKGSTGNKTLTAQWIDYALGDITYNTAKTAIKVSDTLNAELFGASCLDTDGNAATIAVTASTALTGGQTIIIRITATGLHGGSKRVTVSNIKVYDKPVLTVADTSKDYINLSNLSASWFRATAVDSFNESVAVTLRLEEGKTAGQTAIAYLETTDCVGNVTTQEIPNIKLYGLPTITYNTEKTTISTTDTVNAELFAATATDSFGVSVDVTVSVYSGSISAGRTPTLRIKATDEKGNVATVNVQVQAYGTPIISNASKTDFKVDDEITVDTLGLTAKDSFDGALDITLAHKDGDKIAGTEMVYTATATDRLGNVATKDITVKIYGTPTITVGRTAVKDTETIALKAFTVSAKDSFGDELTVSYQLLSGEQVGGSYMTYQFTVADNAGNICMVEKQIGVYAAEDITITYKKTSAIKLTSNGEEFNAQAIDTFGGNCVISIEIAKGYVLASGNTLSLYLVATDSAGNVKKSEMITGVKVYGSFTVAPANPDNGYTMQATDNPDFVLIVYDTFGEEVMDVTCTPNGEIVAGTVVSIHVYAVDAVGNIFETDIDFGVLPADVPFVELYVNGEYWKGEFVTGDSITVAPQNLLGFYGWQDVNGNVYTDKEGKLLQEITTGVKLHDTYYFDAIATTQDLLSMEMDKNYLLINSIDLSGIEWTPMGNASTPFTGVFDGNGYTISNFTITAGQTYIGLFGDNKGAIQNLGVTNFTVNVSYSNTIYAGGLVGRNYGTISNCYATGDVTASDSSSDRYNAGYSYAGGLVGENSDGTISNCYATGDVTASDRYHDGYAGGLVGYNYCGTIENCYATGDVTASDSSSDRYNYAGGLVGGNYGTISNCYATGDVTASSSDRYLGGYSYAGGLVGENSDGTISNCYATGDVTASSNVDSSYSYAGGLVGGNYGTIENCYATGDVTASDSYSYSYAGGLVGENYGTISNCYATGDVTASSNVDSSYSYAGGLVGGNYGTISNCYATGDVTASSSNSNGYSSYSYAGGLVGRNYGTISNCYATGDVAASDGYNDSHAGGLVGGNDHGTISNCYRYSGQVIRRSTNGGNSYSTTPSNTLGTAKTMEELTSVDFQTTTLGWSSDVWTFTEGSHPTLNWQN